jgi:hypothetical protein
MDAGALELWYVTTKGVRTAIEEKNWTEDQMKI